MAKNLTRKRSILVGLEVATDYGSGFPASGDEALGLDKAVSMADYSPTPLDAVTVERTQFRDFVGASAELTASRTAVLNPTCEMVGGGLDATNTKAPVKPQFWRLLLACGMTEQSVNAAGTEETDAAAIRGWKYTVGDPTQARSVAILSKADTIIQQVNGCRGTFVITAELGAIPTIAFTMTGRYGKPELETVAKRVTTGTRPTDVPPSLVGSENSRINGAWPALMPQGAPPAPCASTVSVDCGHTVTVRDCISASSGTGKSEPQVLITDRTTTGAITVDADLATAANATIAGDNPWDTAGTGEARAGLSPEVVSNRPSGIIAHGTKAGEWWSLGGPSITVGAITEEDRDGNLAYNLPLRFVPTGSGNNEFSIIFWGDLT